MIGGRSLNFNTGEAVMIDYENFILRKGMVYYERRWYITTSPVLGPTALYVGPSLNGAAFPRYFESRYYCYW